MASARRLKVLGLLFRTPGWANGGRVSASPTDMADYAWIATWAANRYRGKGTGVEIWNEPDPYQDFWAGTPSQYAQLLKRRYPAIKAGDRALVVFEGPRRTTTASSPPSMPPEPGAPSTSWPRTRTRA
jgi:hypothetical protein